MDKNEVQQMMNCSLNDNLSFDCSAMIYTSSSQLVTASQPYGCWDFWQNLYYPQIIYREYPVYIRERAQDKAKQAYEIIKILKDKKLAKIEKVSDFIDLMDELIKIL